MYYRQYPEDLSRVPDYDSALKVDVEDNWPFTVRFGGSYAG
jgi:hypothetical protein